MSMVDSIQVLMECVEVLEVVLKLTKIRPALSPSYTPIHLVVPGRAYTSEKRWTTLGCDISEDKNVGCLVFFLHEIRWMTTSGSSRSTAESMTSIHCRSPRNSRVWHGRFLSSPSVVLNATLSLHPHGHPSACVQAVMTRADKALDDRLQLLKQSAL